MEIDNIKTFIKHTRRIFLIILHTIIFAFLGFMTSQYLYLEHKTSEPYIDSLLRAGEIVREKGLAMTITIAPPEPKKTDIKKR
jgi:hypothetical protein